MGKQRNYRKKPERKQQKKKDKPRPSIDIQPLNAKQNQTLINLHTKRLNLILGSAGTGKTYLAASKAAQDLSERQVDCIVLAKPIEGIGPSMGFLPGTLDEKMGPWYASMTDVLRDQLGHGFYSDAYGKTIRIEPVEMIRGRSFDYTHIIVEECQNLDRNSLFALIQRMGKGTSLTFMGDVNQIDVKNSGLKWLREFLNDDRAGVVEMSSDDIVRSDECKYWVKKMEMSNDNNRI